MTTPAVAAPTRTGLSPVRQTSWACLGFLSGLLAYWVPATTQIDTNGEWGWLVVLTTWALVFPAWLTAAVLLVVLPGRRGTRRRPYGIGLLLGPAPVLYYAAVLYLGTWFPL